MKSHYIRFLIASVSVLLLAVLSCCERHGASWRAMDRADSLMVEHPDSALAILRSLHPAEMRGAAEKARHALLTSMALDKNYVDTTTFDVLRPAIDYYTSHGTPDDKMRTCYYRGRIYQNRNEMDSAMQCFLKGEEYLDRMTDTLTYANMLVAHGVLMYKVYKFDDVIRLNLKAAELYNAIGRRDYEFSSLSKVLDNAIIRENRQLSDSIMSVITDMARHYPEFNYRLPRFVISYNIEFGTYDELQRVIDRYADAIDFDSETLIGLALAYNSNGDCASAKQIMELVAENDPKAKRTDKYMASLPVILEANGDLSEALDAYKAFYLRVDTLHQHILSHDLLFAREHHNAERLNLIKVNKRERAIGLIAILALALVIVSGLIYYRLRLAKSKVALRELEREALRQKNEKLELEKANEALARAKLEADAENMRLCIEQLQLEDERLRGLLAGAKDMPVQVENAIKERIEMLNGLLASQISDNDSYSRQYDEWRDRLLSDKDKFMDSTRLAFMASHPKFIGYLEEHGLTVTEINYCCLYAIGLRGKEVGDYMQLRRHYHLSSDIRKKLSLEEHHTNLGIYLRKLMKTC